MASEEQIQQAQIEFNELIKWSNSEAEKVIARLKADGIAIGLDGHSEEFLYIRKEECRRLTEMAVKYDLPNLKKMADKKAEIYSLQIE